MTLEEYKNGSNKNYKGFFSKLMFCIFILFIILSFCKLSDKTKEMIKEELFNTSFNFSGVNKIVSKIMPSSTEEVNDSGDLKYKKYTPYLDGVKYDMDYGEGIELLESGIVVFIGNKADYGKTIIVQQSNGVDAWYGNLEDISVNLYDYINKNSLIGTSKDYLYLSFQKDGEFIDYKSNI